MAVSLKAPPDEGEAVRYSASAEQFVVTVAFDLVLGTRAQKYICFKQTAVFLSGYSRHLRFAFPAVDDSCLNHSSSLSICYVFIYDLESEIHINLNQTFSHIRCWHIA